MRSGAGFRKSATTSFIAPFQTFTAALLSAWCGTLQGGVWTSSTARTIRQPILERDQRLCFSDLVLPDLRRSSAVSEFTTSRMLAANDAGNDLLCGPSDPIV